MMRFKIVALGLLFIIRIRFPSRSSIAAIIRKRYGNDMLKDVRSLERLDKKCRKLELDVEFLETCIRHDVIPKFIRFKVVNLNLKNSTVYRECQNKLLLEELNHKKDVSGGVTD